tara:strand:- start:7928 stop:8170 length:243 start_codon:yes stop_codon:yes gene_type:complete
MKSTRKNKKYMVYVKSNNKRGYKLIHFGDNRYQQYKDSTPLKLYSYLDHNDKQKRRLYYSRHGKKALKDTPKYFSHKYLW